MNALGVKLGKISLDSVIQVRQSLHAKNSVANAIADATLCLNSYQPILFVGTWLAVFQIFGQNEYQRDLER